MSEYQYYEFQAIDRPLSEADRRTLRDLSTRARITATSFTNSYEWGDFKGEPAELIERRFDLHLYLANWGSRRLMIRWPARMIDRNLLDAFLGEVDCAALRVVGENLILDTGREELESEDWDDGSGWLASLAPLRAEVLAGDLRLFYLLWLTAVEAGVLEADAPEPTPGIGPITATLEAFAAFFGIDPDLVEAAAEGSAAVSPMDSGAASAMIAVMPDGEKTRLLMRLFEGDPHVGAELQATLRKRLGPKADSAPTATRTVGDPLARAQAIRLSREREAAETAAADRKRQAQEAEKLRIARLDAVVRRGDRVWGDVETEIERRNVASYDRAVGLLRDLKAIAEERGTIENFLGRLRAIRERHGRKERFIERLMAIG